MNKIVVLIYVVTSVLFISCEKEYTCVCTNKKTGEKSLGDKVKTTKLGKKGFEKSCKANSNEQQDCYVE